MALARVAILTILVSGGASIGLRGRRQLGARGHVVGHFDQLDWMTSLGNTCYQFRRQAMLWKFRRAGRFVVDATSGRQRRRGKAATEGTFSYR